MKNEKQDFFGQIFCQFPKYLYLCTRKTQKPIHFALVFCSVHAQMAELVDALVSNTNEAIRAGSIPALGTILHSQPSVNQ